jgi:hypothetical protein
MNFIDPFGRVITYLRISLTFRLAIANQPRHHNMLAAMPADAQRGMSQISG